MIVSVFRMCFDSLILVSLLVQQCMLVGFSHEAYQHGEL